MAAFKASSALTLGGSKHNTYGGQSLDLQQVFTLFPHTPDNSFLGFAVEEPLSRSNPLPFTVERPITHRENAKNLSKMTFKRQETDAKFDGTKFGVENRTRDWVLVYGKEEYMWKNAGRLLDIVNEYAEVHATVSLRKRAGWSRSAHIPDYVKNHGVLATPALLDLLRKVKIFLGLGFPFEGPAVLEAIANGAVFLNPLFSPPKSRFTEKFFREKPTRRSLSSQNPYAEESIGEPYVITLDIANERAVRRAIQKALAGPRKSHLPYEFTTTGFLERLNAYLEHQDICRSMTTRSSSHPVWPPVSAHRPILGPTFFSYRATNWTATNESLAISAATAEYTSCAQVCRNAGLVCERSHFPLINRPTAFRDAFGIANCTRFVQSNAAFYYPAFSPSTGTCVTQAQALLFSCSSATDQAYARLCPCRDFIKRQIALCPGCL